MHQTKILSTGSFHPQKVLTNNDLSKMVDTSDEWIRERTGISERRIADLSKGEFNSEMAYQASLKALSRAGLSGADLDLILVATISSDYLMPSTACLLQKKLGATKAGALDISAACSGFVYGLSVADAFIKCGRYRKILLLGSEILSQLTDWEDRNSCILFGDGSGAFVLGRANEGEKSKVYSSHLYADGGQRDLFHVPAGGTALMATHDTVDRKLHVMHMKGKEIFKEAVRMLVDCAVEALETNGFKASDLDWLIPHQANIRIIEAVTKRLNFPIEKVIVNINKFGNTSSATVPTAFDAAVVEGKIKRGDLVLLDVFGAGLTYGSTLLRY